MDNKKNMSEDEIENFVKYELSEFHLTPEEENKYIKFLNKLNNHSAYAQHKFTGINIIGLILERFEETEEFFKIRFDDEKAKEYAKATILWSDRKEYMNKLNLIRVLNCEDYICKGIDQRTNINRMHARNIILRKKGIELSYYSTIKLSINDFNKKFDIDTTQIEEEYPLTEETKQIWEFIASMDDKKFKEFFNLDRDTVAKVYPTTKEELALLKMIGNLSEEKIVEFYGISKKELLNKYPINKNTLTAIRNINKLSENAVKNIFNDSKENVLKRKQISIEMIQEEAKKHNIKIKVISTK